MLQGQIHVIIEYNLSKPVEYTAQQVNIRTEDAAQCMPSMTKALGFISSTTNKPEDTSANYRL
jgi:hypothetical protein